MNEKEKESLEEERPRSTSCPTKPKLTPEQIKEGWTVHGTCIAPPGSVFYGEC